MKSTLALSISSRVWLRKSRSWKGGRTAPEYSSKVALEHRDFPVAKHAWARRPAIAARFFTDREPELGLEYRRYAMAGQEATNPDAAIAALTNAQYAELVEQDYWDGIARGVVHMPTVFENRKPFIETFTF
ncbi:MAG TPA: hypothetical protein VN924_14475 [Bryobacteraceae bacterium]|jgi:hypothetical protein|nr:hypothetical protein [Bryobacteraceae bacterium]